MNGANHHTVQSLDQIRLKLQLLTTSLQSLHARIISSPPSSLPPFPTLQSSISVTLSQLSSVSDSLARHATDLQRVVVTPNDLFPVQRAEALLTTLLRTKVIPETESWVESVLATSSESNLDNKDLISSHPLVIEDVGEDGEGSQLTPIEWLQKCKEGYDFTGYTTRQESLEKGANPAGSSDGLAETRRIRQAEEENRRRDMRDMLRFSRTGRIR